MELVNTYLAKLDDAIQRYPTINGVFVDLEKRTQVKKVYLAAGVVSLLVLWLMFGFGAQLLCNGIGFVYPAYCSVKAIESKNKDDDVQWLMYWVVFAVFSIAEFFSDFLVGWVPFYWLAKCLFLVWCMSPLNGSTLIYQKLIVPFFYKNKGTIDNALNRGKAVFSNIADEAKAVAEESLKNK